MSYKLGIRLQLAYRMCNTMGVRIPGMLKAVSRHPQSGSLLSLRPAAIPIRLGQAIARATPSIYATDGLTLSHETCSADAPPRKGLSPMTASLALCHRMSPR